MVLTAQIPHKIRLNLKLKPGKMIFPVTVRHRREKATIYGKSPGYDFYRLGYYVAGQRRVRSCKTYGEAKAEAERIVRELAEGSQAAALSGAQSRDTLAAIQRFDAFRQSTGRRVSLLGAVSEYVEVPLFEGYWEEGWRGGNEKPQMRFKAVGPGLMIGSAW
jgi:hypothetical protein